MNNIKFGRYIFICTMLLALTACSTTLQQPTPTTAPHNTPTPLPTEAPPAVSTTAPTSTATPISEATTPIPPVYAPDNLLPEGASARLGIGTFKIIKPSPDNTLLAVAGDTGIHIFDMATFAHLRSLPTIEPVYQMEWSPDGALLTASLWSNALVWDARTGEELFALGDYIVVTNVQRVLGVPVAFNPDGSLLATAGCVKLIAPGDFCEVSAIHLWDTNAGIQVNELEIGDKGSQEIVGYSPNLIWSPDGNLLAGQPYPLIMWDVEADTQVPISTGFENIRTPTFSPDFRLLAFGTEEGFIVQELLSGQILHEIHIEGRVYELSWSPDSSALLVEEFPFEPVYTLNIESGKFNRLGSAFDVDSEHAFSWSPDSSLISIGLWDEDRIIFLDATTGELVDEIEEGDILHGFLTLHWLADGSLLALAHRQSTIARWEMKSGELTGTLQGTEPIFAINWSPDGHNLLMAAWENLVLWDTISSKQTSICSGNSQSGGQFIKASWLDEPDMVIANSNSYEDGLSSWNILTCEKIEDLAKFIHTLSPDNRFYTTLSEQSISVRDIDTRDLIASVDTGVMMALVDGPVWSPDGTLFAARIDEQVIVSNPDTGETIFVFDELGLSGDSRRWAPALSPDGSHVAFLAQQSESATTATVYAWDMQSSAPQYSRTMPYDISADSTIVWSPDGTRFALMGVDYFFDVEFGTTTINKSFSVHDIQTGNMLFQRDLTDHMAVRSTLREIAWSPDGTIIATAHGPWGSHYARYTRNGSSDSVVNLWDPQTGELLRTFKGHTNSVMDIEWSPDGSTLASASGDGTVILWEIEP